MTETSPKRDFFLNKEVTAESLKDIIWGIHEVNNFDELQSKKVIDFEKKPIKLIVDTFGGECYSGMTLVNAIEVSPTPVHSYCYGKAMSMGLTIYAVGHKRFAHRNATFMQHQLSGGSIGTLQHMKESVEQKVILQDMLDEVLIDNTKIQKSFLLDLREKQKDWYFKGDEAFRLGLVDELIDRKIKR